jgi:hypothetical protein
VTEKGENKFDGEGTYPMMEESPSRTLQVDRRREEIIGEEKINNKVKAYSGLCLI